MTTREKRKAMGLCTECGKAAPLAGVLKCQACSDVHSAKQAAYYAKKKAERPPKEPKEETDYWWYKKRGICVTCKAEKTDGKARCPRCAKQANDAAAQRKGRPRVTHTEHKCNTCQRYKTKQWCSWTMHGVPVKGWTRAENGNVTDCPLFMAEKPEARCVV